MPEMHLQNFENFRVEKMKHSLREYEAQACGLYEAAALPP